MNKLFLSKLLLAVLAITPMFTILSSAAYAEPVLHGVGMVCRSEIQAGKSEPIVFSYYADYIDGADMTREELLGQAPLNSSNPAIADVESVTGIVTAYDIGTTVISAVYGGHQVQCNLDVTDLIISPETTSIDIDETETYTATYVHSDGSTEDVTDLAIWSTSNPAVAIPDASSGQFKGIASGSTVIQASYKFGTANTNLGVLNVQPPSLVSVKVLPENPTIQVGEQQAFTATANYSDGTTQDVTSNILSTWMVTNPMVAVGASIQGTYQGNAAGTSIVGVCFEVACDSTNLKVVPLPTIPPTDPPPTVSPPTEHPVTVAPKPEPTPEPEKILGKVYGVVQDITGKPLKGVRVEIHSDPQTTFTDENGAYLFSGLPLGEHTVRLIDDDLKEIGRVSVIVGDIEHNNKDTRLVLSEEKAEAQVSFYIEPIVEKVIPEEKQPEPPTVKDPDPIAGEKPEPKREEVKIEKPEPPKMKNPVKIQTVVQEPQTTPEPEQIVSLEPEQIITPEPTISPEPIVSESPEPVTENEPSPVNQPKQKPNYVGVVIGSIAAAAGIFVIIMRIRRKRITVVVKRHGEAPSSINVPISSSATIEVDIFYIVTQKGWIEITISPKNMSKIVGKTLRIHERRMQYEPIIEHEVTKKDAEQGFSKKYHIN